MNRKHSVIIGASTGLVVGIIMSAIGLSLWAAPESFLRSLFIFSHAPAVGLLDRLHESHYDWNTNAGLLQVLAVFLVYWVLPGFLAGLCWRTFWSQRYTSHVA
jgi:hypothetical protein